MTTNPPLSHPLAQKPPIVNVLSDSALPQDSVHLDRFGLEDRLGPVFDIIRHPKTRPPMAIALYGDWGAGKTSAMRWLHGLLDQWNAGDISAPPNIRVRPVWFYPWKYQSKEDVWRGLVAEVILASINTEHSTVERVKNAAKRFGKFLGRSFVHALSAIKLQIGDAKTQGAHATIDFNAISEVVEEYQKTNKPQSAYLNHFEDGLREWVTDTISDKERMCIFIDDLDRCMPEVGLQVLEALKLYLNIDKLIFVVGVDESVITRLVSELYKKHGLGEDKSKYYLAKMFQVEVRLSPTEKQIERFLSDRLNELDYWRDPWVDEREQEVFEHVFRRFARANPREVKRLINSALIASSGAVIRDDAATVEGKTKRPGFSFRERLHVHFVDVILRDRYSELASFRLTKQGDEFFREWSEGIIAYEERLSEESPTALSPTSLAIPWAAQLCDELKKSRTRSVSPLRQKHDKGQGAGDDTLSDLIGAMPSELRSMVNTATATRDDALLLLADQELSWLMRLRYPVDASSLVSAPTSSARPMHNKHILVADDEDVIRESIAQLLKSQGAVVTSARDGDEAIKMIGAHDFDLVISDIKMPLRNGYEVFQAAKARNNGIAVILITGFGYDPNHSIVRAHKEGLSGVLFKPFKVDQVLMEVYRALDTMDGSDRVAM